MHVYLRDEPIALRMEQVDGQGLIPEGAELVPVAFYAQTNDHPSFRALLPPETVEVLREALTEPVTLGVLAEEPEDPDGEIQAMVGLTVPVSDLGGLTPDAEEHDEEEPSEPWRSSAGDPEAWRGQEEPEEEEEGEAPRAALLAFAPLVRLRRKFPYDFAEELADLLEAALSGSTRPALEARIDRMLGDI